MNEYPLCEFHDQIQEIQVMISSLPIKEQLLFKYEMGYKFSKSVECFRKYFAEGLFINYPELSYVKAQDDAGLSFTVNKECLLMCAIYGDQLTQIPLNVEHPYYSLIKSACMGYRGLVFDEYYSNLLLTGKNISLRNPYVLKEIIKYSNARYAYYFFKAEVSHGRNICDIYKKIGYDETAEFCRDLKKILENKGWHEMMINIDKILPNDNIDILDIWYFKYIEECRQISNQ